MGQFFGRQVKKVRHLTNLPTGVGQSLSFVCSHGSAPASVSGRSKVFGLYSEL